MVRNGAERGGADWRTLSEAQTQTVQTENEKSTDGMDFAGRGVKRKEKPKNRANVTHRTATNGCPGKAEKWRAGLHTLNRKSQKQNSASLSSSFPAFRLPTPSSSARLAACLFPRFSTPLLWLFHRHCGIVGAASGSLLKRRGPQNVLGASKNVIGKASAKKRIFPRQKQWGK